MVERDLAKVEAAGSNPVSRSAKSLTRRRCDKQRLCFLQLLPQETCLKLAGMVELVDTQDLKSCGRKSVRVRFPLLVLMNFSDIKSINGKAPLGFQAGLFH